MKYLFSFFTLLLFVSCDTAVQHPRHGPWRAVLDLGNDKELPFLLDFTEDRLFVFHNAEEDIISEPVIIRGDSIIIEHPVFEGVMKGVFTHENISGSFIKPSLNRVVPFQMTYGSNNRFEVSSKPNRDVSGNWETVFSPDSEEDRYISKGIFEQKGAVVTGTFRTTTGDYRFLEGTMDADTLRLSTFDAAHAFLFEAVATDSTLAGVFYSGNHFSEPFVAHRNENYELPNANALTFLKEGYDTFGFSFPDTEGKLVSLEDARFQNKVVVVQIMGTWCPNCLDETKFYTEFYKTHKSDELEFVSLAFEYAPSKEKAVKAIERLKEKVGVPYPILLAQAGSSDKVKANDKLPMLNHILSYPTTIFIDKQGEVRKIHTGFNGPATGSKYTEFVAEFESFVASLLEE
jgi:thiol-disulfide isomerase/thioredoxin